MENIPEGEVLSLSELTTQQLHNFAITGESIDHQVANSLRSMTEEERAEAVAKVEFKDDEIVDQNRLQWLEILVGRPALLNQMIEPDEKNQINTKNTNKHGRMPGSYMAYKD